MRGVFQERDTERDEEEVERTQRRQDTELTLGLGTLLILFFGLVLLCGLCFGLGYTVGHRTAPSSADSQQPATDTPAATRSSGSPSKPSATTQPAPQPAPSASPDSAQAVAAAQSQPATPVATPAPQPRASAPPASTPAQPQARPALPVAAQPAHAAAPTGPQLMVQIAAVSHEEDAVVLAAALRKRGYTLNVIRDPADDLIHVRIGPFTSRDEASRWRLKLLNDGYNAMILP